MLSFSVWKSPVCLHQYTLRCDLKRPLLAKDLSKSCEFIVHSQVS